MAQYWKRHVCVGCGSCFRYTYAWLRKWPRRRPGPSMRPCPTCGLYQPDMIGGPRLGGHLAVTALGLAFALIFVIAGAARMLADRFSMWGAVGCAALVAVGHLLLVFWNPNRNPEANRRRAKELIRSGQMEFLRGETPDRAAKELPPCGFRPVHGLALAGMAFASVIVLAAELVRLACGWPMNPDWIPGVIGPGDESRLYFAESFGSVKGLWTGEASAWALNAHELGLRGAALEATTNHDTWAGTIYVENDRDNNTTVTPWVEVRVPNAPGLAGRQCDLRADLVAQFPEERGQKYFNRQRNFTQTTAVRLAARPGAGKLYESVWHVGGFVGVAWLGLMSLAFVAAAWSLRRRAFRLQVVHDAEDEPDDGEDYDEDDRYDPRRRRRRRDDD